VAQDVLCRRTGVYYILLQWQLVGDGSEGVVATEKLRRAFNAVRYRDMINVIWEELAMIPHP
jgi:hypothetical protein